MKESFKYGKLIYISCLVISISTINIRSDDYCDQMFCLFMNNFMAVINSVSIVINLYHKVWRGQE